MFRALRQYGQREIYFPGEEVLAKYGAAFLKATVLEVMGEGGYKVKFTDFDVIVIVNIDLNEIKKCDVYRPTSNNHEELGWNNYFSDNFYDKNRDHHASPIRKSWKAYSPRKTNILSFSKFQSPKRSILPEFPCFKDKKPCSPMTDIIDNLNTLINSPVMGRFQKSPMVNFPRTPGNRRVFSSSSSSSLFPHNHFLVKEQGMLYSQNTGRENIHPLHHSTTRQSSGMYNGGGDEARYNQFKEKPKPLAALPYLTWSGKLPPKDINDNKYSRKVFLGGVPWDITNDDLEKTFSLFGSLSVEWPPIKNGQKPKGYVYIVFDESSSVNKLLEFCRSYSARVFRDISDGTMYKYHVQSEKMKSKEIQVIPWNLNDSTKVIGPQDKVNMHHQVFVGGLHGMLTATGLSKVMNDLFGNVVYVEIDTDKYKYPLGSGRVNFSSMESYQRSIQGKYVQVKCSSPKIEKRIQIDPYIRENENCSKCIDYPGPLYCRSCFEYFCEGCWDWHMRHSSVKHEWVSRTRNVKVM